MIKEPNTDPIPAPEPATPTVAAPAPMNLAAESMSLDTAEVWKLRTRGSRLWLGMTGVWTWLAELTALTRGRRYALELETRALLAAGAMRAQANMVIVCGIGSLPKNR